MVERCGLYLGLDHRLSDVASVHVGGDQRHQRAPEQTVQVARHLAREIAELAAALAEDILELVKPALRHALKGAVDGVEVAVPLGPCAAFWATPSKWLAQKRCRSKAKFLFGR